MFEIRRVYVNCVDEGEMNMSNRINSVDKGSEVACSIMSIQELK